MRADETQNTKRSSQQANFKTRKKKNSSWNVRLVCRSSIFVTEWGANDKAKRERERSRWIIKRKNFFPFAPAWASWENEKFEITRLQSVERGIDINLDPLWDKRGQKRRSERGKSCRWKTSRLFPRRQHRHESVNFFHQTLRPFSCLTRDMNDANPSCDVKSLFRSSSDKTTNSDLMNFHGNHLTFPQK